MINVNDPVETYIGNGTLATYSFNFKVRSANDILIIVYNTATNALVFQERGNVLSNVTSVTFDAINGGGSITLPANLASQRKLIIVLAADTPTQTFRFRDQSDFDLRQFENALDNVMINVQRVNDKVNRSFRLSDKASYTTGLNMEIDSLPVASGVPIFDSTGTIVEFKTPAELAIAVGPIVNGITTVADNTARDAIASGIRYQGMLVYVTSTLKNWQLQGGTANVNWIDITAIVKTVADDTARNAITAGNRYQGMIAYVISTSKNWQLQGGILDANWVDLSVGVSGSSGGAENLVTNGTGEFAPVSIFTPYADSAGTRPVDGTGGTPNVTTALNSTNPINGTKDYTLIKDASNRQGQGWATTVSIPLAYRAKSLKLNIKYLITSGTFVAGNNGTSPSDGDVIWYFYDVTNSKLVEPSNIKMFSNSTNLSDTYEATVQFDSNTSSVRLIAHVASTSASAYTIQVDDVTLSPQVYVYGTPITDWVSFTPTGSWSTNTTYSGFYRRIGSEYEYQMKAAFSGAPGPATALTFNLPFGHTMDTNKIADITASYGQLKGSSAQIGFTSSSSGATGMLKYNSTTSVAVYSLVGNFSPVYNANTVTPTAPVTLANTDFVSIYFKVPVVGLGATTQMSDSSDTRQEYFSATKSGNQSISNITTTKLTFDTYTNNSHGSWDIANNRYIVKTAGPFNLAGTIGYAANATGYRQVSYAINGGTAETANQTNSVGASDPTVCGFSATTPYLNAGDYIELFTYQNSGGALNAAFNLVRLRITKLAGPQAISASERIAFSVFSGAGQSLTNNAFTDLICNTKSYDSHNIYNTTTGVATIPRSGIMSLKTAWLTTNHAPVGAWSLGVSILKNGISVYQTVDTRSETSTTTYPHPTVTKDFEVKAGDLVKVQIYRSSTTVYGVFNGGGDPTYVFIDAIIT